MKFRKKKYFKQIVTFLFVCSPEYSYVIDTCCSLGSIRSKSLTADFPAKAPARCLHAGLELGRLWPVIPNALKSHCAIAFRSCCFSTVRSSACQSAQNNLLHHLESDANASEIAANGRHLSQCTFDTSIDSPVDQLSANSTSFLNWAGAATTYSHCCQGCRLGIKAAVDGFTCKLSTQLHLDMEYRKAHFDCCSAYNRLMLKAQQQSNRNASMEQIQRRLHSLLAVHSTTVRNMSEFHSLTLQQVANIELHYDRAIRQWLFNTNSSNSTAPQLLAKTLSKLSEQSSNSSIHARSAPTGHNFNPSSFNVTIKSTLKCRAGYTLNATTNSCDDIDECARPPFPCPSPTDRCVNLNGSYFCQLHEQLPKTKNALGSSSSGGGGESFASKNKLDANELEVRKVIQCTGTGLRKTIDGCFDINECRIGAHNCDDHTERCVNTFGGFRCDPIESSNCSVGFRWSAKTGRCDDVNECRHALHDCAPFQRCENLIGSFRCVRELGCGTGYTYNPDTGECEDDDECESGTHNCRAPAVCVNVRGSFRCVTATCGPGRRSVSGGKCVSVHCEPGFVYVGSKGGCVDVDECLVGVQLSRLPVRAPDGLSFESHTIAQPPLPLTSGSSPNSASSLKSDKKNEFVWTNEALQWAGYQANNRQACPSHARCVNSHGGFRCNVRSVSSIVSSSSNLRNNNATHVFEADTQTVNEITQAPKRISTYNFGLSSISTLSSTTQTVTAPSPTATTSTSNNQSKSCQVGFRWNETHCVDVDECAPNTLEGDSLSATCWRTANALCVNTIGSYYCDCQSGYRKRTISGSDLRSNTFAHPSFVCDDVDECSEGNHRCEHSCLNVPGSYVCLCDAGFRLSSDRRNCDDLDECSLSAKAHNQSATLCAHQCVNVRGSYRCECPSGYELTADGHSCSDLNECRLLDRPCSDPATHCVNTHGSFRCEHVDCPPNYIKDAHNPL